MSSGPPRAPGAHTRAGNAMGRTRRGLVEGAARAFAEHGLRGSTMQSIARAAGVAKATLYNHFRTKDEVARALLASELERLTAAAAAVPPPAALTLLADEFAGSPVLRRMRVSDPEILLGLLAVGPERWSALVDRLAGALGLDVEAAELPARWLLGLVLQPGRSTVRRRHAAVLVEALGLSVQ